MHWDPDAYIIFPSYFGEIVKGRECKLDSCMWYNTIIIYGIKKKNNQRNSLIIKSIMTVLTY